MALQILYPYRETLNQSYNVCRLYYLFNNAWFNKQLLYLAEWTE